MKKYWIVIMLAGLILLAGCEEDKTIIHYKVYRENRDGTHTMWVLRNKPSFGEGFVYWKHESGANFSISGKITIEPFIVKK